LCLLPDGVRARVHANLWSATNLKRMERAVDRAVGAPMDTTNRHVRGHMMSTFYEDEMRGCVEGVTRLIGQLDQLSGSFVLEAEAGSDKAARVVVDSIKAQSSLYANKLRMLTYALGAQSQSRSSVPATLPQIDDELFEKFESDMRPRG
jgi:hypothetical protein